MKRKNTIRFTESELKRVISESVKKVLTESMSKTYITYDGISLELSMNGDDMYLEYYENNR